MYIYIYTYIYIYICVCVCVYSVSSTFLIVFGDDRIRGIREQMMSQVDLVMRRAGVGLVSGEVLSGFLYFYDFK